MSEKVEKKEESELTIARKQVVAQRSDLVQKSRTGLTRLQGFAVRYMISKVKPNDEPHQKYTFSFREFSKLMRYKTDSYTDIKNMLQAIGDISWWRDADSPEDDDKLMRWLNIVHVNERKGTATISFHEDVFPYILNLQQQYDEEGRHYFNYMLQYVSLMKGVYSADLYELLRSYSNRGSWDFEIGTGTSRDIQRRLAKTDIKTGQPIIPNSWSNFAIFKRDVLEPCKKEINQYTDIVIDYEASKIDFNGIKHRKYVAIKFFISAKTELEQEYTDRHIDEEYRMIEEISRYKQLTIQDIFAANRASAKEESDREMRTREADQQIKEAQQSKHPVLKSVLSEYTEEDLDHLYTVACTKMPKEVAMESWEMWVTDYLNHYNMMIRATAQDTKTTPYKRLLDMAKKDYDQFAEQITGYNRVEIEKLDRNEPTKEEIQEQIRRLQEQLETM